MGSGKWIRKVRFYSLPKQDCYGEDILGFSLRDGVFLLCDGASEGFNGRSWARKLCAAGLRYPSLHRAAFEAKKKFHHLPSKYLANDWSGILAKKRGSYSTLLRARIEERWIIVEAIGDTCLFVFDGPLLVSTFPYADPIDFLQAPCLISDRIHEGFPPPALVSIPWREYSFPSILMSTDAFSRYLLSASKEKQQEILHLLRTAQKEKFQRLLKIEKAEGGIQEDDISVLWVELKARKGF